MAACPTCQREGYSALEVRLRTGMKAAGATLVDDGAMVRYRTKGGASLGIKRSMLHDDASKSIVENLILEARKP